MIPDFPAEKEKLMRVWNHYLEKKHRELLGFFGEIPAYRNYEGHDWMLYRADGSKENTPYHEIKGLLTIHDDEIPNLTPNKVAEKLDQVAEEMARQTAQGMLEEILRVTEEVGNIIDAQSQPLTKEMFLKLFEAVDMSFDQDGKLISPSIIMHPDLWEANKEEFKSWEADPGFITKQEDIINRKREEWRVRESRRQLVD